MKSEIELKFIQQIVHFKREFNSRSPLFTEIAYELKIFYMSGKLIKFPAS